MSAPNPLLPTRSFPRPPADVAPLVAVLGVDLTVQLLLRFGGAELYVAANPKGKSRLEALVGPAKTRALALAAHHLPRRVPLANAWVAACLNVQGWITSDIARCLRISDVTARRYLARAAQGRVAP